MINAVVFDLGNVLIEYQPLEYLKNTLGNEENAELLYDTIFTSKEWLQLDEGTLVYRDATRIFQERVPELSQEIAMVMDDWHYHVYELTETTTLLKELKERGYTCYYLSNFQEHVYEYIKDKFSFWQYLDGGVFSFAEKLIKPDRRIYETLLKRFDLEASQCVFMDDMEQNILGARALGMHGIVFQDIGQVREELERMLAEK
ncbi:HAD family phosphatase [Eubacteriales bacterium OttesenSCG-928-M02]|nr:HAD family phosphatase [Eubacteriales bacterium OttesenSCG-928-M02]